LKTGMQFGECLSKLIYALNISSNRLSKAINVDSSLVNRWIHGKRIPSYNTPYIESISEYLSKNVYNTYQIQRISNLLLESGTEVKSKTDLQEIIKTILLEAQGYSLECKKNDKKVKCKNSDYPANKDVEISHPLALEEYCGDFDNIIELSANDKIIIGSENIHAAIINLLNTVGEKAFGCNIIYISLNNEFSFENNNLKDLLQIRNELLKALSNGWCVKLLIRLSNNLNRTIRIINYIKPLIKTGKVFPYYIKKYDIFTSGKESIVVPEYGAISGFSTTPHSGVNCAFYFKNTIAINILQDYFYSLIETSVSPLVKYYTKSDMCEYGYCLLKFEDFFGNRYMYEYGFSSLTIPKKLFYNLLSRTMPSKADVKAEYDFYIKRIKSFQKNIKFFEYKDIYSLDSMDRLINNHQLFIYTSKGIELVSLEIVEIIELLQNIVNMLKTYEHYYIAFLHHRKDRFDIKKDYCYVIKERQGVLFETFDESQMKTDMVLSMEEPMISYAFVEYFKEIWENIAPPDKDKKEIILWLESNIKILNEHCLNHTII